MLEKAGYEVILNPYGRIMTKEQMFEQVQEVSGIIIGVDPLDKDVLKVATKLRAIAKYGVGTDNIDLDYARERRIPVSVTAGANTNAVADFAFTLMLCVARKVIAIDRRCRNRDWSKIVGLDIYGKTLGILGLGAIGKGVAKRAKGFDMKVLAYDISWDEDYARKNGIIYATPHEIYEQADFISIHLPLTDDTRNMIDSDAFARMKKNAVLVNTARGGIVDEAALVRALKEGRIMGAGIDVFSCEPPEEKELYELENLVMGSHCAASTEGALENMSLMAVQNLLRDLKN